MVNTNAMVIAATIGAEILSRNLTLSGMPGFCGGSTVGADFCIVLHDKPSRPGDEPGYPPATRHWSATRSEALIVSVDDTMRLVPNTRIPQSWTVTTKPTVWERSGGFILKINFKTNVTILFAVVAAPAPLLIKRSRTGFWVRRQPGPWESEIANPLDRQFE